MKNFAIIIIYMTLFIGCKKGNNTLRAALISQKNDTIKLDDKDQVIFINPTLPYIDSLKKTYKNKDDFYTMADDANFYVAEAGSYVLKNKVDTTNVNNNVILKIGKTVILTSKYKPWTLLLYQKGNTVSNIFPVDIQEQFPKYFNGKNETYSSINDILGKLQLSTSNIIYKNELDFNKDNSTDYVLILQDDKDSSRNILFLKKNEEGYSLVIKNNKAIPCEECGNGAESFYDYNLTPALLSFSSSYKSNDDIYRVVFEFKTDKKYIYVLDKVSVHKSLMGDSNEINTYLDTNKFGVIPIGSFNYSEFLEKFILI